MIKINKARQDKRLLDFFAEAGMLKRINRSGWWVLGIKDPETVAEHSFRCAVIGYALAKLEDISACKVLLMTLFNDIHEARINDLHKMSQRYIDFEKAEEKAFEEQVNLLSGRMREELTEIHKEYIMQQTKESIIARDADILECLIQAKEYYEHGFRQANKFMKKAPEHLKTKSARRLWMMAKHTSLTRWWEKLSEFRR